MALSASVVREPFGTNHDYLECRLAASDVYYKGAILCFVSGYAAAPGDNANSEVAGIFEGKDEEGNSVDALTVGSGEHPRARLRRGLEWIAVTGCAQTDVGVIHYVGDDTTMTKTAGSKTVGYRALDFKAGHLLFDFRCPDRIV